MSTNNRISPIKLIAQNSVKILLQRGWLRVLIFSLIWWILTNGDRSSWFIGVPAVLFATWLSVLLLPSVSLSLPGIAHFIPFFLWQSLCAAVNIARQVLHPNLPITPVIVDYQWRLPPGLSRVFMANTVSLLPGTLSLRLHKDYLRIHVLNQTGAFISELPVIEACVAQVFTLDLALNKSEETP